MSRFPPEFLDELRARLPVSEVVGRRVKLKKAGREWKGLSPFNQEKTPSFFANDQKAMWFDFSSGRNGNIFDFVIATEGVSFPEAVERLAALAGLPVPKQSPAAEAQAERRRSLYDVMELAAKFFEATLASRAGARARGYLADRGIDPATQLEFRLGYAPAERFSLKEHLGAQGVPVADMVEAGLLVAGDDIPVPFDRFRDRIIIPIHDQRGRVVAFGGRTLRDDVQPKYLNSPETPVFHKGTTVFNFHRARQPAFDDGSVVVVEGYMDAISVYQAGIKSVVATMGTAFTEEQINSLWRLSTEPIICFDGDRAGIAAAHRSLDRILPVLTVGRTFKFAFLPIGTDPDDLIRSKGVAAFRGVLESATSLWDMLREREVSRSKLDTPDARAALEQRLYSIIRTITDKAVQTAYHRTCRIELAELFWKHTKGRHTRPSVLTAHDLRISKEGHRRGVQQVLLGLFVHYPQLIEEKYESTLNVIFDEDLRIFYDALYMLLVRFESISVEIIYAQLPTEFYPTLDRLHGDKTESKVRGHQLIARFPVVRFDPPEAFISECIDHFIEIIMVDQMAEEIDRFHSDLGRGNTDEKLEKLPEMVRNWQLSRERVNNQDVALAEEAKEIRRLGRAAEYKVAA
ncbi:MAG: DNA primase [Xanthobacteraceae bacterium]